MASKQSAPKRNRKVEPSDLLARLDSTDSLAHVVHLEHQGGVWHFYSHCPAILQNEREESIRQEVSVLEIIQSEHACRDCWASVENTWEPGLTALHDMGQIYTAECSLRAARRTDRIQTVTTAVDVLSELALISNCDMTTWKDAVAHKAQAAYEENLPKVTSERSKRKAQAAAKRLSFPVEDDSTREDLVALSSAYTQSDADLRTLSVPYLIEARKGYLLLKTPSNITAALANTEVGRATEGWLPHWGAKPFQSTPLTDSGILDRAVEMWNPEDPLFGDLDKLLEAAYVIR